MVISEPACEALEATGERMVPEKSNPGTFWAHIYRYRFAAGFVRDKRVLDIACGEGYGTEALLRAGAASAIGIDISEKSCAHARRKYGIDARTGRAENIPLPDGSIDVIVSFETIEHVAAHEAFLDECVRTLVPGGKLIISTPNKQVYGKLAYQNPFHCSELSEDEFVSLLAGRFVKWQLYSQRLDSAAWWSPRSLGSTNSAWARVRGFARAREMVRGTLCPHIRGEVDERFRQSPHLVIRHNDGLFSSLLDPYSVRKRSHRSHEQPVYVLAVAEA